MPLVSLFVIQLVLPGLFVAWLALREQPNRLNWLVQALATAGVVGFAATVGNWGWTSFWLLGALLVLFGVALVRSFRRTPRTWWPYRWGETWQEVVFNGLQLLFAFLFVPVVLFAVSGYDAEEEPLALAFPLRHGVYSVGHGGSNPLINYHNVSTTQRYALDIVELNPAGIRTWGLYPRELERYAIFGETLYSPCAGTVETVRDGLPDLRPPDREPDEPAGNHVVLRCDGARVYLAHMMRGSIRVREGETVQTSDVLGRVGNSGITTEPHLHLHAVRDSAGVPVTFDGRFLVRNSLVW